ncbi:MAG: type I methionyl aminopeptidase [Parcubacteria group bacterium]|nr:type I methionyl aminopeptidase [Parcubacteria group bacterium]MCR4342683.1 type I methionyl aminopeptidase [Patescibacteria group bacterium]
MSLIKTKEEIQILREGGKRLAFILHEIVGKAKVEVSAEELNKLAIALAKKYDSIPSFLNYKPDGTGRGYPAALCVSVNDEVVHGLPFGKIFKDGDIVGFDFGLKYKGLYTDMAITVGIGEIDSKAKKLINATEESLNKGIAVIRDGATVGDIGEAVQKYIESQGFSIVRKLVGHGVGHAVHEAPEIPNYGNKNQGFVLREGMILALEPMVNEGDFDVTVSPDGFTWKTRDHSRSAHFEHTILVTKTGTEILTLI